MKTKMPVRRNFDPTPEEMMIRRAIHLLQDRCNDELILCHHASYHASKKIEVYLIPSIMGEDQEPVEYKGKMIPITPGTIEYQVSDGLPSHRSTSLGFYNFADAFEKYKEICEKGWD